MADESRGIGQSGGERQARVLVVDDDRVFTQIIASVLEREGFMVATASDGEEGLQKAQDLKPHLIILDVMMPKLDGYEVCRRLREQPITANILILMLTALGEQQVLKKGGFAVGADDLLTKPVKMGVLRDRVKALLWFSDGAASMG